MGGAPGGSGGLVALFAQAVRFGKPRDVVRKLRRQHREFAEAAGRLLEEAGELLPCRRTLTAIIAIGFCKRLLFDMQFEDAQLCDAVERRAGPAAPPRSDKHRHTMQGPMSRQKLLEMTHELHRAAEAI